MIVDRVAIAEWNRANERARTMYYELPTSSRPKCDACGRISDTAICEPCQRGEPRYTTRPTACGCGAVTWAQTGVCRRCQTGKSDTT